MIIIADENIDHKIIKTLQDNYFEVYSVYFTSRGMSDLQIAEFSVKPPKIILTEDKDFGEMVFKKGIPGLSIILLRYPYYEDDLITKKLIDFLKLPLDHILHHFTTISTNKTRSRKL